MAVVLTKVLREGLIPEWEFRESSSVGFRSFPVFLKRFQRLGFESVLKARIFLLLLITCIGPGSVTARTWVTGLG